MIYTVRDNLQNTIAGKVKHQVELEYALTLATTGERMALIATLEYLKVNIDELKRILQDVEKACEEHSLAMWEINPERMGQ
jgi:uncharacterized membrane protein